MDQILSHWLKIRPEERRRTALLFFLLFCATSYVIVGRTARDALFLANSEAWQLPLMYVGIAGASSLAAILYGFLVRRWAPSTLLVSTLCVVSAGILLLWWLIRLRWTGVYSVLYIFHEVAGSILTVLFWTFANEAFTTREAKRLFGIIGSGGVMAGTVCGFGGAWLAPRVGTANLLLLCLVILACCVMLAVAVGRLPAQNFEAADLDETDAGKRSSAGQRSYARAFGGLAVVLAVCVSIVDYEFKVVSQSHYTEEELATFFGTLFGTCGLLSFTFHLLFTGRFLNRVGILPGLLALPTALSVAAIGILSGPTLAVVTFAKAADASFRYSLNETCLQLLYLPVPIGSRRRLKATLEASVKPFAIGVTGLVLFLVGHEAHALRGLGIVLAVGLALWILLALRLRDGYVSALVASLGQGGGIEDDVSVAVSDVASTQALIEALRCGDAGVILGALELLPARRGMDWGPHVLPLLSDENNEVRLAALEYCRAESIQVPEGLLSSWLEEADERIRAVALDYLNGDLLTRRFLKDPSPMVQAHAIVCLIQGASDPGGLRGAWYALEQARRDKDALVRRWAAWALGEIGGQEEPLRQLIEDSAPDVVLEAIESIGKSKMLGLVPLLLEKLHEPAFAGEAAFALGQYGEVVLPKLLELLPLPEDDEDFRLNVFTSFRQIGSRRVAEELIRRLSVERHLRLEMLQVTFQLLRHRREGALRLDQVREPMMADLHDCYQWWVLRQELGETKGNSALDANGGSAPTPLGPIPGEERSPPHAAVAGATGPLPVRGTSAIPGTSGDHEAFDLLLEAARVECDIARERTFLLLAHVYPVRSIQALSRALQREASVKLDNALELVEEIVDPELRRLILPLLEDITIGERVDRGKRLFPLESRTPLEWCRHLLTSSERWLKLCALHALAALKEPRAKRDIERLLGSEDPLVRESALITMAQLLPLDERPLLWWKYLEDPAPRIRQLARERRIGKENAVISSVDKVLFLKRVELFSQLPGRELMHVASIAEQVSYPENTPILQEGAEGDSMYVILSGQVKVSWGGRRIAKLGPRECFGEMTILDREPRSATVTALDQVSLLRIEHDSFHDLLSHNREIAMGIIRILVKRLRIANER